MTWQVGDRVRIGELIDNIGDPRYVGHIGTITKVATSGEDCGESEANPMLVVKFDQTLRLRDSVGYFEADRDPITEFLPGVIYRDFDGFWTEELQPWV